MKISICIPTYNRDVFLKRSLDSLVRQKVFIETDYFEIIISDNNSSDFTKEISLNFVKKFRNKVLYFRNRKNVQDRNFYEALRHSSGDFLKLCNDTLIYKDNYLLKLLELVSRFYENRLHFFFFNFGNGFSVEKIKNINIFYRTVSYQVTWLGTFSCWKDDFKKYGNILLDKADSRLAHVFFLNKILENKNILLIKGVFAKTQFPSRSGNYNIIDVFFENYKETFCSLLEKQKISLKTYNFLIDDVLNKYVLPRLFNFKYVYIYNKAGIKRVLVNKKKYIFYILFWFIASKYKIVEMFFRRIL